MAKRGRPLKFESLQVLEEKINEYFSITPEAEQMITGLAVHLDTSRETLCDYEGKDEYSDAIKRAKEKIEMAYEKRGLKVGNAFDIFRLKNMGWRDRQETDVTSGGERIVLPMPPELIDKHDTRLSQSSESDSEGHA